MKLSSSKPTILFMGTPEFARVSLAALNQFSCDIVAVYSQPDKPSGRGREIHSPPCALFAKENGMELFQPESVKTEEVLAHIESLQPDLIVVAAYGKKLPTRILHAAKIACINVHASLLPKYRGASPVNWALINGDEKTGVTIMQVIEAMDAGPIYAQKETLIDPHDNTATLTNKLAEIGAQLLVESIPKIISGELKAIKQDELQVTHAGLIKKEDGKINWGVSAREIHNIIRGYTPWPSAHTMIDNKLLKIYDSEVIPEKTNCEPGTVYLINDSGLHVACSSSSLLVKEVQLAGKKKMQASEFARGYRLEIGKKI